MIEKLICLRKNVTDGISSKKLFPSPPIINCCPTVKCCPVCQSPLKIYKTIKRKIITLHLGSIKAQQVLLSCNQCDNHNIYSSEEITKLIPKYGNFGYDVIEYIGRAIYQHHRTEGEVVKELADLNVHVSKSEIGYLCRKFIVYLAVLHKNKVKEIKSHLQINGGYILHLDGTNEGASPHLISALDELSQFVLASVKIPTENADQIIPLLKDVKKKFGIPLAIVTDMGRGILLAVKQVFNHVSIFICHFHFLRDIGKDLLETPYSIIRNLLKKNGISTRLRYRLRQYKKVKKAEIEKQFNKIIETKNLTEELDECQIITICYVLIQWALDGKNNGNGYGFPFDRPHLEFYNRLCRIQDTLEIYNNHVKSKSNAWKIIQKLLSDIKPLTNNKDAINASSEMKEKIFVFDNLRQIMRITVDDSKKGINDNGEEVNMKTMEEEMINFKNDFVKEKDCEGNRDYQKMIKQIDKYWTNLFAAPIPLKTQNGEIIIQPQRTNNIMEQFFRGFRRAERRKSGNNSICKRLQTMIAETPLVKNLENPSYMTILLNGNKSLPECFAGIQHKIVHKAFKETNDSEEKISPKIKKIIRNKDIPSILLNLSGKN